jgi:hypothetical protein
MSDIETLKAEIRKLSARATSAKMNLHDLSEELPVDYQKIPAVAQEAFDAYRELTEARARLKTLESV